MLADSTPLAAVFQMNTNLGCLPGSDILLALLPRTDRADVPQFTAPISRACAGQQHITFSARGPGQLGTQVRPYLEVSVFQLPVPQKSSTQKFSFAFDNVLHTNTTAGHLSMQANWTTREDHALLRELIRRGMGTSVMSGPSARIVDAFRGFSAHLPRTLGRRTSGQCRRRFLTLRAGFYESLNSRGGFPPPAYRPSGFDLLLRLWLQAGRPAMHHRIGHGKDEC